jgi:hypothetical protein
MGTLASLRPAQSPESLSSPPKAVSPHFSRSFSRSLTHDPLTYHLPRAYAHAHAPTLTRPHTNAHTPARTTPIVAVRYSSTVHALLTLPLSQPAQRRQAHLLRRDLRRGVSMVCVGGGSGGGDKNSKAQSSSSGGASSAWLQAIFDGPLRDEERWLNLEIGSAGKA